MTLPADLDTALKAIPALAAWPARAWEIEQLGGVTNRNYRLRRRSSGGGAIEDDFVLRLPGSGTSSYLNRPAGIYNAMQAAAIGIAPPVFFTDVTHGWQLSRYLSDSRPLEAADLRAPGLLSAVGGLPEYQPPLFPPVGVDDVAGLTDAFDELADPLTATLHGAAAARHYADSFAVDHAADGLVTVLTDVGRRSRKTSL